MKKGGQNRIAGCRIQTKHIRTIKMDTTIGEHLDEDGNMKFKLEKG